MTTTPREQAELAKARFLQQLRERVTWQADAADRLRRGLEPAPGNVVQLRPHVELPEPESA